MSDELHAPVALSSVRGPVGSTDGLEAAGKMKCLGHADNWIMIPWPSSLVTMSTELLGVFTAVVKYRNKYTLALAPAQVCNTG